MQYQAGGIDLMDIAAGGHLDQSTTSWLGARSDTLRANLSTHATNFFNKAVDLYSIISTSDAIQAMRNLVSKKDHAYDINSIYAANTVDTLQTANIVMQRYIMAEPSIRELYLNSSVSGYNGSYVNLHGDAIGSMHYDYRRVTQGMVVRNEDQLQYSHYYDTIGEGDRELTIHEKVDILKTWNAVQLALDANETDPTSPEGNLLG